MSRGPSFGYLDSTVYHVAHQGLVVKESSHGWGSHVVEYFAVGTTFVPQQNRRAVHI